MGVPNHSPSIVKKYSKIYRVKQYYRRRKLCNIYDINIYRIRELCIFFQGLRCSVDRGIASPSRSPVWEPIHLISERYQLSRRNRDPFKYWAPAFWKKGMTFDRRRQVIPKDALGPDSGLSIHSNSWTSDIAVRNECANKWWGARAQTGRAVLIPKLEGANVRQGLWNMAAYRLKWTIAHWKHVKDNFRGMRRQNEHWTSIALWGRITWNRFARREFPSNPRSGHIF
jgi:hypothetical protein